ncbi:unannotated protein [freshwater metagenome]|uniref:Unannotated protein n=1 Tax=freshwater metagenome TaxID=449393 RepID=A0A6J6TUR0_9ZZZZ
MPPVALVTVPVTFPADKVKVKVLLAAILTTASQRPVALVTTISLLVSIKHDVAVPKPAPVLFGYAVIL